MLWEHVCPLLYAPTQNLSASFSQCSCPTNKETFITANWKSLAVGEVKDMLESNAMPAVFSAGLSLGEDWLQWEGKDTAVQACFKILRGYASNTNERPLFPRNTKNLRSSCLSLVQSSMNHFWCDYWAQLERVSIMLSTNRAIKAKVRKMWIELISVNACHLTFKISEKWQLLLPSNGHRSDGCKSWQMNKGYFSDLGWQEELLGQTKPYQKKHLFRWK